MGHHTPRYLLSSAMTVYIGGWFEWSSNSYKSYVSLGSLRVAMSDNGTRYYLIADDLGSTSVSLDANQATTAETRYKAYVEQRTETGTLPTTLRFTGQRLDSSTSLLYYGARYYDPYLRPPGYVLYSFENR